MQIHLWPELGKITFISMGNIVLSAWSDLDVWLFDVISIPRAQVHTWPNFGEISSNIYEVQVWPKLCEIPFIGFYRASIWEGDLGSRHFVRPSVCLSVCLSHACIVTKLNDALQIFLYHTKGQWLCYSDTKSGWSAMPHPSDICAQSDPPLRKTPTSTDFLS